jgi:triosephosphate isomerase
MKKKSLIIGNWKMNLTPAEATSYLIKLQKKIGEPTSAQVVICPGFLSITAAERALKGTKIELGAQNVASQEPGALTGEIAAKQLEGLVRYVIVGHSERRIHLGERDREIATKLALCHLHHLTPILAVGETLHDYEERLAARVVNSQLTAGLRDLDAEEVEKTIIAYEPVWAIGTGKACSPRYVSQMIAGLRSVISALYGEEVAAKVKFLYGGSINSLNAEAYLDLEGCGGLLVGHESLELDEFAGIVKVAERETAEA